MDKEFQDRVIRIKDIEDILKHLLENKDKIENLVCIYDFNDEEIDGKGIYHSCAGNLMMHYGMLEFIKNQLEHYIKTGEYNYKNRGRKE